MTAAVDRRREDGPLFHRRTAAVLMCIGLAAFVAFIALRELAPELRAWRSVGADAFSRSAIGYGAFVETLEAVGLPTRLARFRPVPSSRPEDVLVLAMPPEPSMVREAVRQWEDAAGSARTLLLVLPKWKGRRDADNPRWVDDMELLPSGLAAAVLNATFPASRNATVRRITGPASWQAAPAGGTPSLSVPQLANDHGMDSMVGTEGGTLVLRRELGDHQLVVISDPDLISNMGLGQGDNAAIAVGLIANALEPGGTVVFDETIHGFQAPPSLWRLLVSPRFLPATLAGLCATIAMAWMASGRFGAPGPRPDWRPDGKRALFDGGADLLLQGGHAGATLTAYAATLRRDVERRLHAPAGRPLGERDTWLRRVGESRGVTADGPALLARAEQLGRRGADNAALVAVAGELHRWRREMLDGSGRGSRPR